MIKQNKPLQTRYETTYIFDRYYIRTHVYVFLFCVKKNACLNHREFDLIRDPYIVFIGPVLHFTIKTCLKTVQYCGYE